MSVLHLIAVQIECILDLLSLNIVLFQLSAFDSELAFRRVELFALLRDFSFIFGLFGLESGDLIRAVLQALVKHLNLLMGVIDVF